MFSCLTCGKDWSSGEFSEDCEECGGGAMERNCVFCQGKCDAVWKRMPMDSNDFSEAHWAGGCKLSKEEQDEILQSYYAAFKPKPQSESPAEPEKPQNSFFKRLFGLK